MNTSYNARLIVESGIFESEPIELIEDTTTFGRSPELDVVIDNKFISRRHFQIRFQDKSFYILDLGSTSGTFVNDERLDSSSEQELKNNDAIRLAELVHFTFHIDSSDSTEETLQYFTRGIRVESGPREVYLDGKLLKPPLSRKAFDIVSILYRNRGNAVSRDKIALVGWPEREGGHVSSQEIEQSIHRLRKCIEPDSSNYKYVTTVSGYGYRMP